MKLFLFWFSELEEQFNVHNSLSICESTKNWSSNFAIIAFSCKHLITLTFFASCTLTFLRRSDFQSGPKSILCLSYIISGFLAKPKSCHQTSSCRNASLCNVVGELWKRHNNRNQNSSCNKRKKTCFAFYLVSEGHLYTGEAIYKLFLFKFFKCDELASRTSNDLNFVLLPPSLCIETKYWQKPKSWQKN